jgi:WD40 repeat protein
MPTRIFLSYARSDDHAFVKQLYEDLTNAGFTVWFDRESLLSRGLPFHQEIKDAIRTEVDRLIYVSGPHAAQSPYVREEWQFALECDNVVVTPILRLGDYDQVPGELSLLHCEDFRDDANYLKAFGKLIESLRQPNPKLGALVGVPNLPAHFQSRPDLMRRVRDALLVDLQTPQVITSADARVGVQGMGGIGKSVLAAALARNRDVRQAYPDGVLWVSFGQNLSDSDLMQRQRDLAKYLGSTEMFDSLTQGKQQLQELLQAKSVLIVLDDVWRAADTAPFDVLGPRSRMLITTRDAGILHSVNGELVPVSLLAETEALQLLANSVSVAPADLPADAQEVARECGYLPLALALSAGMAKKRNGDFHSVLERLRRADLDKIADRESINAQHQSIWRAMQASVEMLPEEEQRRFAELAVFDTDGTVPEAAAATLWHHTGGLDDLDTEELLINLFERSLIQQFDSTADADGKPLRRFRLHDLLHDYAVRIFGDPKALHETLLSAYSEKCPAGWPTGQNDGYFYQNLPFHLSQAGRSLELRALLLDYRWLQAKLDNVGVEPLLHDYTHPHSDSVLNLVEGALRLSAHVVSRDPRQLAGQLVGRLIGEPEAELRLLCNHAEQLAPRPCLIPQTQTLTAPGGPLLRTLQAHIGRVTAVALTANGNRAVSGSDDTTLKVWDVRTGLELRTLEGHTGWVSTANVAQGLVVSGSGDGTLKAWDLETGQVLWTLVGHTDQVLAVALTLNEKRAVSGSNDNTLKVWNLETGRELRTLVGHTESVTAAAVTPDGKRAVSGSADNTLKVWEMETGRELCTLSGHTSPVTAISVGENRVVSGSNENTLKVWDLETGRELRTLHGHTGGVTAVAMTLDGKRAVSGSYDNTLKVWDLETGRELRKLEGHRFYSFAVTPDGKRAVSASGDNTVKIWDLESERELPRLGGHTSEVFFVAASHDIAVSISVDKTLKTWDLVTGRERPAPEGQVHPRTASVITAEHPSFSLASSDMRSSSGRDDKMPRVWDPKTGRELATMDVQTSIYPVAAIIDGRLAVSGAWDYTLKVWDLITGMEGHDEPAIALAFTPDEKPAMAASGNLTPKVCDRESGREWVTLEGHTDWVRAVALTPDGKRAVSGSGDNTLKVWDLETGDILADFAADGPVCACSVATDGNTIVAGDALGRVHFLSYLE